MGLGETEQPPFSPTTPFRFCPVDGTKLGGPRQSGGVTCPRCGRSWYRNPVPATGAVIVENDHALVTVRAREPEKGRLDLPGGFLDPGEHPVDGLAREAREELGVELEVDPNPILLAPHTYGPEGVWVLAIGFRARITGGDPTPTDDVAGIRWLTAEDVDEADFAWEHDRRAVREALQRTKSR